MKFLKWTLIILLVLVLIGFVFVKVVSEEKPVGVEGPEAEALADRMMEALNYSVLDSVKYISWDFGGRNKHIYDHNNHKSIVQWKDYEVHLNHKSVTGIAYQNGIEVTEDKDKLVQKAWSHWCNDSFWLLAPFKIKDPGTSRSIVDLDAEEFPNKQGLMITYDSGGVTPGDSYLWILDENNIPVGYKMWVSIIPIGGLYATWTEWKPYTEGLMLSSSHDLKIFTLILADIKTGKSWSDIGFSDNPLKI